MKRVTCLSRKRARGNKKKRKRRRSKKNCCKLEKKNKLKKKRKKKRKINNLKYELGSSELDVAQNFINDLEVFIKIT